MQQVHWWSGPRPDLELTVRALPYVVAAADFHCDYIICVWGVHHEGGISLEESYPIWQRVVPSHVGASLILAPFHIVHVAVSEMLRRKARYLRALPYHRELRGYVSYKHWRWLILNIDYNLDPLRNLEPLQARKVRGILPEAVKSVRAFERGRPVCQGAG